MRRTSPCPTSLLPCAFLLIEACSGQIIGWPSGPTGETQDQAPAGTSAEKPSGADPSAKPAGTVPGDPNSAGPLPLRRLTRTEYDHVATALLGTEVSLSAGFPSEPTGSSGFATPGQMSDVDATLYERGAGNLATLLVGRLNELLPCAAGASGAAAERSCAEQFVRTQGLRMYRRPVSGSEVADHLKLYDAVRAGELRYEFRDALRVLAAAMLQTPDFLYHWEAEPAEPSIEEGTVRLDPYQLASRLSFFLWQSMPDEALFSAAETGKLETAEQVEAQARRMLSDARAAQTLASFFPQWLNLDWLEGADRDPGLYPEFNAALAASMKREILDLSRHFVLETDGSLLDLLTTPLAFVDEGLAKVYGLSGVSGTTVVKRELDPETRPGLLTRAGVLAVGSNAYEGDPTKRGKLVREQLLCQGLSAPPPGIPPLPPPGDLTVRARHEQHASDPSCNGCHRVMDPIGFGFGHFDAIGRFLPDEQGRAIDTTGQVVDLDGESPTFRDVQGLIALLSESDAVRDCFMRQWLRYALGRKEQALDDASLEAVWTRFSASGFSIRELLVSLTVSRTFLYRAVADGEPLP